MSQSQISKVETGRISPSLEDIDRIIRALGVQQAIADEVRTQFDMLTLPESDFRKILSLGLAWRQRDFRRHEAQAVVMRDFQLAAVPGLCRLRII